VITDTASLHAACWKGTFDALWGASGGERFGRIGWVTSVSCSRKTASIIDDERRRRGSEPGAAEFPTKPGDFNRTK
jgi:hypothetical protein